MATMENTATSPTSRFAPEAGDPLRDNGYVTAMSHFYRGEARQRRVLDLLKDERNCGRKTLDEITRWMDEKAGMDANVTLQLV
jgi:hypothetical protein